MKTYTVEGTYGGGQNPCAVICAEEGHTTWYAVEDSQNVNQTTGEIVDGVDVETVDDCDCFTWPDGIDSEDTLIEAIEA